MLILLVPAGVFLLIAALYVLVPPFFGPPSVPTKHERIRKALQLTKLQPNEVIYDLGANDGRVLVIAANEFHARAVGIEIGPVQCAISLGNVYWNGAGSKAKIVNANFFHRNLGDADVVFAYLTSTEAVRLQEKLKRELKSGARVVTISFNLPNWEPEYLDGENLIFLYVK